MKKRIASLLLTALLLAAMLPVTAQAAANGAPQPLDEVKGEQGQDEMDKSFDEILRIFNKDKF